MIIKIKSIILEISRKDTVANVDRQKRETRLTEGPMVIYTMILPSIIEKMRNYKH